MNATDVDEAAKLEVGRERWWGVQEDYGHEPRAQIEGATSRTSRVSPPTVSHVDAHVPLSHDLNVPRAAVRILPPGQRSGAEEVAAELDTDLDEQCRALERIREGIKQLQWMPAGVQQLV